MKFEKLIERAKRMALKLAQREIARILERQDLPKDVKLSPTEGGVRLAGKKLKSRIITDAKVRDVARGAASR